MTRLPWVAWLTWMGLLHGGVMLKVLRTQSLRAAVSRMLGLAWVARMAWMTGMAWLVETGRAWVAGMAWMTEAEVTLVVAR